ncbi:hypothetical protein CWI38_0595p0060 [Hamiltosporidium tvaerminnensis]|uniref:Uncharacterized protein n=1 Tax=Hamiltosporidium tvaerminnensis TaxID=1176355 RepID=A0A4Q9LX10_9MICR|nr:hypothetical protein CWI38_0595p0060 [Hamiltosporidium tvaerminnensis]
MGVELLEIEINSSHKEITRLIMEINIRLFMSCKKKRSDKKRIGGKTNISDEHEPKV